MALSRDTHRAPVASHPLANRTRNSPTMSSGQPRARPSLRGSIDSDTLGKLLALALVSTEAGPPPGGSGAVAAAAGAGAGGGAGVGVGLGAAPATRVGASMRGAAST